MEYFDYMKKKIECASKLSELCEVLNKRQFFGNSYNGNALIKQLDFYNSCDKLPPYERDLSKSFGNMVIFLSNCGVIL